MRYRKRYIAGEIYRELSPPSGRRPTPPTAGRDRIDSPGEKLQGSSASGDETASEIKTERTKYIVATVVYETLLDRLSNSINSDWQL